MSDTFEQKVNELVKQTTRGDDGKLVLPEGLSDAETFAVRSEIRQRDTRSAYTKAQQSNKVLQAENEKLSAGWAEDFTKTLTSSQQTDLEELKISDPDAWRQKLGELEGEANNKFKEKRETITKEATFASEEERRTQVLADFSEANPDITINDDVLENDVPPRFVKQLEAGEVTFEDFLDNVKGYLTTGKVIKGAQAPGEPNLGKQGGGATPNPEAIEKEITQSYNKELY